MFYNERWLAWTSGYYCAQKMNNVFYKWALYYCYYCHHSSILIFKRASSLVLNMIGYDCFLMIFIHLLNYTHGSLTCFSASRWEGRGIKYMLPFGPIPRAGLLSNYLLAEIQLGLKKRPEHSWTSRVKGCLLLFTVERL